MHFSATNQHTAPRPRRMRWVAGIIISLIVILLGTIVVLGYVIHQASSRIVPAHITGKLTFPAYIPKKLPGNYRIVPSSFRITEESVLAFHAEDGTGSRIVFTEQRTPKKMDFADFYSKQFTNPKTLDDVPYPTVIGKSASNTVLSIAADDTWIIVTTRSPLSTQSMQEIAKSIKRAD